MSREDQREIDGFVVVDKASGLTSQDVVLRARRLLGARKAGHSGTLDRFATGVLPVLLGRYARLMRFFMEGPKAYVAEVAFGKATDTLDPEGSVVSEGPLPTEGQILSSLHAFRGKILQAPPEYSAVHVGGKRAYERALSGETVTLEPRPVEISRLELCSYRDGKAIIEVECSKGTYIRSLARDIAASCGTVAHLSALRRTMAAGIPLSEAIPLEDIEAGAVRSLDETRAKAMGLSVARVDEAGARRIVDGKSLAHSDFSLLEGPGPAWAVFCPGGFLAILSGLDGDAPAYEAVIGGRP